MFDFLTQMFNSAAAPRPVLDSRPVEVIKAEVLATHARLHGRAELERAQAATEDRLKHEYHMQVFENQKMIMRALAILLARAKQPGATVEHLMESITSTDELTHRIHTHRLLLKAENEDTSRG